MTDKPIDIKKAREISEAKKLIEEHEHQPIGTMKPMFDSGTYFKTVMEANAKAKVKAIEDKRKRNALTKKRFRIKDVE